MIKRTFILGLWLTAACQETPEGPPAATPIRPRASSSHEVEPAPEPIPPGMEALWDDAKGYGFRNPSELAAFLKVPEDQQGRAHAWAARTAHDASLEIALWHRLAARDPNDVDAALREAEARASAGDATSIAVFTRIETSKKPEGWRGERARAQATRYLCVALTELGRFKEAQRACDAARALGAGWRVSSALAELELARGDASKAAEDCAAGLREQMADPDLWFLDAVALSELGQKREARQALQHALESVPWHDPAMRAFLGLDTRLPQQLASLKAFRLERRARWATNCARGYDALGLASRAQDCIAVAAKIDPLLGKALRIELDAPKDTPGAKKAFAALLKSKKKLKVSAPVALAGARMHRVAGDPDGAVRFAEEAMRLTPTSLDAQQLLADLDHAPAHPLPEFPVQMRPRVQASSYAMGGVPPALRRIVLTPYAKRPIPEMDGLDQALKARFPGLDFSVEPLRPLPPGTMRRGQVVAEYLLTRLGDEAGQIAIIEADLGGLDANYFHGLSDMGTARGVVSANRFRSKTGEATPPSVSLNPEEAARSKSRFLGQVTSTLGKLLGVSFPCQEQKCVLRFARNMDEFDAKGADFCPKHKEELAKMLQPLAR